MIVIIPIGGIGQRFKNHGYTKPKALIKVFGKSIISYLIECINMQKIDHIYIPYNKEYTEYNFEETLRKEFPNHRLKFLCLNENTRGVAETISISLSKSYVADETPILCLDCDNFYTCDIVGQWSGENMVFTFKDKSENPIYSYVKETNNHTITEIQEKVKISDHACCGAYGFKSSFLLREFCDKIIQNNQTQKNEFYTSGVVQSMIDEGYVFINNTIERSDYICLGTPLHLKIFYNNYPKKNALNNCISIEPKRICFDLDNTLVSFPHVPGDYTTVMPIWKTINILKYLKKIGNTIIIYTARRMRTHHGNVGRVTADIGKITFDTLDKFDIPYDEIYFGKPQADFYIDDLAVNRFDDIEKEIGFYDNIIEPREFHTIEKSSIETIIKTGDKTNMGGEIYYYENIPKSIKDLFPIYFGQNENGFMIEKINGISVSDLFVSEILTEETFSHILNSIKRIHNCDIIEEECDNETIIYNNYSSKLYNRYQNYDYSQYKGSHQIYNDILKTLTDYEDNKRGRRSVIHGDPVFTNIIVNNYGKIKFIDMRGKLGDIETIVGDELYDWAKVYQSLIGYDEILLERNVSDEYRKKMVEILKNYVLEIFGEEGWSTLKIITQSLLFSLLPLHRNEKCLKYYQLIRCSYLTS